MLRDWINNVLVQRCIRRSMKSFSFRTGRNIFRIPYVLITNCARFARPTASTAETLCLTPLCNITAGILCPRRDGDNGDDSPAVLGLTGRWCPVRVGDASGKRTGIEAVERILEGGRFFGGVLDGWGGGVARERGRRSQKSFI